MDENVWGERLRRVLSDAEARPVLFLLEGVAGSGKSTLAGRLRQLARSLGSAPLCLSFSSSGAPLAPESARRAPEPAAHRTGGVAALLDQSAPAFLLAEDVQRAGPEDLAALRARVERAPRGTATLITYRPEELPLPGLPFGLPAAYPGELAVLRGRTQPLSVQQTRRMAFRTLGSERSPHRLVAHVHRRTGGIPQVVHDVLQSLVDAGSKEPCFSVHDVDAVGVPVRLAELTAARLHALGGPACRVAEAAAVLDEPVGTAELLHVARLRGPEGRQALAEAVRGALLQECAENRYGFAVPLAGTVLYEALPGPEREELHHRAAEVLTRRRPVPWAHVADHRRRSGRHRGWLRAVERAAGEPAAFADHDAAMRMMKPVFAADEIPQDVRGRLALRLARNAVLTLPSGRTAEVLRQIIASQGLAHGFRGEIRLELGLLLNSRLEDVQGRRELERAVSELKDRPELAVRAMAALSNPFFVGSPLRGNLRWLERAEQTAAASGNAVARTTVAAARVTVATNCGDPEAWHHLEQLPAPGQALTDREHEHVARSLGNAACGAVFLGHYRRAAELLERADKFTATMRAPFLEQCNKGTALLLDFESGRWEGLAERCRELVSEVGIRSDAQLVLGQLALARGEWAEAERWWPQDRGTPTSFAPGVPYASAVAGCLLRLALARRQDELAVQAAEKAWTRLRHKGVWVWGAALAPWAVEAWTRTGRLAEARRALAEFAGGLDGSDAPTAAATLHWCRAVLAEASGEPAAARAHFTEASTLFARHPRPYAAALTLEGAGRCGLAVPGAAPEAVRELGAAVAQLEELGAPWDCARVRSTLREAESAARGEDEAPARPRGRPGYGDKLSPREREVADLATAGLTNREIAHTLHLSPRTVEHHIARAMQKTGTQSRLGLGRAPRP
ncbi:LuxR C-terminal-related transcriptional regulator [Streptomyces sp. SCSIO ZS0520]|uniref:LuxR C-terminal-related transcriptional regulator n=1 Tax=Streptomyces sp. SCSIO ZS0520 TaxID=2892996 RepID=UPI0021DB6878|nr:LuxR family transcriptional regulator [Streptomyces sp. SCSIO ZS0520]UFZ14094.1 LuxR family transcriptional regulator [Streptomyces sp.]